LDQQWNAALEELARHGQMMRRRHDNAGGIDEIQQWPVVVEGLRIMPASDGLGLFRADIGNADELDVGKTCENACVFLAEMPDADDRHPKPFHGYSTPRSHAPRGNARLRDAPASRTGRRAKA